MTSFAVLLLRAVTGGFLAGHGAQKLFGAFGGRGPEGTARNFEKIGIEPARKWAVIAGATELTGGALTAMWPSPTRKPCSRMWPTDSRSL